MCAANDDPYLAWNKRVGLFWLSKPTAAPTTYLTVTPTGLAAALWECDGVRVPPEQAEDDLVQAVQSAYRRWVLQPGGDISFLAKTAPSGDAPLCLAFLALSVLAAHRMHADGANRSTAYYARLAQLLDCPCVHEMPQAFSKEGFESLWHYAARWTSERAGRPLFLPKNADILRKYVAYPLAHVGLRQVDLGKLPEFFEWAAYAPGAAVALERIREDLRKWAIERGRLTAPGRAACDDDRRDAVLLQVAQELTAWDGVAQDASGRKVAHVELTLDVVRGVPRLSYLARRPPGFPEVFEHGVHRFDSLEEGWYDPLPVPRGDGPHLLAGFEWVCTQASPTAVLRRCGDRAIAFVRSEDYSGLTSRRRLLAGVECAVLYHDSVADAVEASLAELVATPPVRVDDPALPEGWRLLLDVKIDRPAADVIPGLEALEVDAAVELMTLGGLRIGRRAAWLVDRPPRLLVSGMQHQVLIDGRPAKVVADGFVELDRSCRSPGVHRIEAGRSQRRIELVEARVADQLPTLCEAPDPTGYTVGLARGSWTVVGERPGQIVRVELASQEVFRVQFEPIWAIRQGAPGCALYLLSAQRSPRSPADGDRDLGRWADAINSASESRTPLASLDPAVCAAAQASWRAFLQAAKNLRNKRGEARSRTSTRP